MFQNAREVIGGMFSEGLSLDRSEVIERESRSSSSGTSQITWAS